MVSKVTLSTISSLIKSMRTRKASKYDFIVHVDSKGKNCRVSQAEKKKRSKTT